MPATARKIEASADDLASEGQGGRYAELEVPADYEAILKDVEDYDFTARGKGKGWLWTFTVEGLPFKEYTSFSKAARWKLIQVVQAFSPDAIEEGINTVDPNVFVGQVVGVHIDWQTDPDLLEEGEANYREIKEVFALPAETADGKETSAETADTEGPEDPEVL